jgi:hypothetical protein
MPRFDLERDVAIEALDCGLFLGQAVLFPEVSRLGLSASSVGAALALNARRILAGLPVREVYRRTPAARPVGRVVELELTPPPRQASFVTPATLAFHALQWRHGDELELAFVPALGIEIHARTAEELDARLPQEIRAELFRRGALASLRQLVVLQRGGGRAGRFVSRRVTTEVELPTPKQADQLAHKPAAKRSVLREVARRLVKRVRRQPFLVLLLDEVEKAAPEVFDVLLGLLDEGRLTDVYGRLTSFRSAIVIMTSNLGVRRHDPLGFAAASAPGFAEEVARFFRPEFVNRIDEIVTFSPLSEETVRAITVKELREVAAREGHAARRIGIRWSDEVVDRLAAEGTSARYGARDLQRTIERRVVIPLARDLVDHPAAAGVTLAFEADAGGRIVLVAG